MPCQLSRSMVLPVCADISMPLAPSDHHPPRPPPASSAVFPDCTMSLCYDAPMSFSSPLPIRPGFLLLFVLLLMFPSFVSFALRHFSLISRLYFPFVHIAIFYLALFSVRGSYLTCFCLLCFPMLLILFIDISTLMDVASNHAHIIDSLFFSLNMVPDNIVHHDPQGIALCPRCPYPPPPSGRG
jgi:hypothetical protein